MDMDYKNKIISKAYLILILLITVSALAVGVTFGRFLTQSEHSLAFSAEKPTKIYLNEAELLNKTLFQPQMTRVGNEITAVFTLKNYGPETAQDAKTAKFHIRAFIEKQDGSAPSLVQMDFSDNVNNVVYSSKIEPINENTNFHITNNKNGQYFRFYEKGQQNFEKIYTLGGEENGEITFTMVAKGIDFDEEDLSFYLELVK